MSARPYRARLISGHPWKVPGLGNDMVQVGLKDANQGEVPQVWFLPLHLHAPRSRVLAEGPAFGPDREALCLSHPPSRPCQLVLSLSL